MLCEVYRAVGGINAMSGWMERWTGHGGCTITGTKGLGDGCLPWVMSTLANSTDLRPPGLKGLLTGMYPTFPTLAQVVHQPRVPGHGHQPGGHEQAGVVPAAGGALLGAGVGRVQQAGCEAGTSRYAGPVLWVLQWSVPSSQTVVLPFLSVYSRPHSTHPCGKLCAPAGRPIPVQLLCRSAVAPWLLGVALGNIACYHLGSPPFLSRLLSCRCWAGAPAATRGATRWSSRASWRKPYSCRW